MCVKGAIQQKMSRQWRKKWILHLYSVLCHISLTMQFWCRTKFQPTQPTIFSSFNMQLPALPVSQDWAEMSLFSLRRMSSVKMIAGFTAIQEGDFKMCFQQWQDSWSKCVCAQEQWFKGDWFMSFIHTHTHTHTDIIPFLYKLCVSSADVWSSCMHSVRPNIELLHLSWHSILRHQHSVFFTSNNKANFLLVYINLQFLCIG
jgi:hypothetical protein